MRKLFLSVIFTPIVFIAGLFVLPQTSFVYALPDLVISSASVVACTRQSNDMAYDVQITIDNRGTVMAGDYAYRAVIYDVNEIRVASRDGATFGPRPGESTVVNLTIFRSIDPSNPTSAESGYLDARVDIFNEVAELNEGNNGMSHRLFFRCDDLPRTYNFDFTSRTPGPDLIIASMGQAKVRADGTFGTVNIREQNIGSQPAGPHKTYVILRDTYRDTTGSTFPNIVVKEQVIQEYNISTTIAGGNHLDLLPTFNGERRSVPTIAGYERVHTSVCAVADGSYDGYDCRSNGLSTICYPRDAGVVLETNEGNNVSCLEQDAPDGWYFIGQAINDVNKLPTSGAEGVGNVVYRLYANDGRDYFGTVIDENGNEQTVPCRTENNRWRSGTRGCIDVAPEDWNVGPIDVAGSRVIGEHFGERGYFRLFSSEWHPFFFLVQEETVSITAEDSVCTCSYTAPNLCTAAKQRELDDEAHRNAGFRNCDSSSSPAGLASNVIRRYFGFEVNDAGVISKGYHRGKVFFVNVAPECSVSVPSTLSVVQGQERTLTAQVAATGGTIERVVFDVRDPDIVSVNPGERLGSFSQYSTRVRGEELGRTRITTMVFFEGQADAICEASTFPVIVTPERAWWQAEGADVVAVRGITSIIPESCAAPTDCRLIAGERPGVAVYGSSINTGEASLNNISATNWHANSPISTQKLPSYSHFERKIASDVPLTNSGDIADLLLNGGTRLGDDYYLIRWNGDLTIEGATLPPLNFGDRKVVLFVRGDLKIEREIRLNKGKGFFMAAAERDIEISQDLRRAGSNYHLEGIFVAGRTFRTLSRGSVNGVGQDVQLRMRGMVVGLGYDELQQGGRERSFDLRRSLSDNSQVAETFTFAPDLLLNFPPFLGERRLQWREVAP